MSAILLAACAVCAALSLSTLLLLCLRRARSAAAYRNTGSARMPMLMRLVWPLALLLEPLVSCVLAPRLASRIARDLDALGLAPPLTPARWTALRVALGFCAGATGLLLAGTLPALLLLAAGYLLGGQWMQRQRESRQREILRELPSWLDMMTVCVEAGATLTSGLRLLVEQAPASTLRDYFERVLREVRGGRTRASAFSQVAELYGVESLSTLASALAHAEGSGMSLGQVLRAQAEQRTAERFARAEKLAMQAPVKMLGPLILCIFPCTFIVIAVPIAVRLKEALGA
jgi:tight adherence protein C